jgi:hypothetical protein
MTTLFNLVMTNNDPFIVSLLQKCNPFGLTTTDGKSMFFMQEVESYFYILSKAWTLSPKGYIEVPLLLKSLYCHLQYADCVKIYVALRPFDIQPVVQLENWSCGSAKKFFNKLCAGLCSITLCKYSAQYVDQAWQLLQQRIEIEKMSKMSNVKCGAFTGESEG